VNEIVSHVEEEYPLAAPYSRYSALYDDLCQSDLSQAFVPLVEQSVQRYAVSGSCLLDLACGTGSAAILLTARGFTVTGVDLSSDMLKLAREKVAGAGVKVDFRQQDMARLDIAGPFDVVTCLYDSLNHLLDPKELVATFQGVVGVLAPGGIFIFDVNTAYCMEKEWGNRVAEEHSSAAMLVHLYSFDPATRIGTLELLCLRKGHGGVERFREVHHERGYTEDEVVAALDAAGLIALQEMSFPDLTPPREDSSRLVYVARRGR